MRNIRHVVIELDHHPRFPFFAPGAMVAFVKSGARNPSAKNARRRTDSIEIPVRTRVINAPLSECRRRHSCRRGTCRRAAARCGARTLAAHNCPINELRIRGRVISRRLERRGAPVVVSCRLTAFVYPPDIVHNMFQRMTLRNLDQVRRQFLERAPDGHLRSDLRLYSLLSLQRSRVCISANRRPILSRAWMAFVRSENRRMHRRLRSALQRLERAGRRGGP